MKENGLAIVLTSHYMDEVETSCDDLIILREGETVFHGTTEESILASGKINLEEAYLHFAGEEEDWI